MTYFVHIDFETRSEEDIKNGVTKYATNPSTEVLCAAINSGASTYLEADASTIKADLEYHKAEGAYFVAHNASFEIAICKYVLGVTIPADRWICTAALARYYGLPGSLDDASKALGLPQQKGDSKLMKKLCKPRPKWKRTGQGPKWFDDPEDLQALHEYCKQDVAVEKALFHALPALPIRERKIWIMDQRINNLGIPVDVELAKAGSLEDKRLTEIACKEMYQITGNAVETPKQVAAIISWLDSVGVQTPNLAADTVRDLLKTDDLPPVARQALEIRKNAGGNAASKFDAVLDRVSFGGRVRDSFLYGGAHTLRWTSKGVQFQNIKKAPVPGFKQWLAEQPEKPTQREQDLKKDELLEQLAEHIKKGICVKADGLDSAIRPVICAPPGKAFVVIDYSGIEARGVAWIADQKDALADYASGADRYRKMASVIYGAPPESFGKDSSQRALGKAVVLGAGYGMGASKFEATCLKWGLAVDTELAGRAIEAYRKTHRNIVGFWYDLDRQSKDVANGGAACWVSKVRVELESIAGVPFLKIVLPSGRPLYYPRAHVGKDGQFTYWGRRSGGSFGWCSTWGGGLTENDVQGFCRDLLADAMLKLSSLTDIVMHVHDEPVMMCDEEDAEKVLEEASAIMRAGSPWSYGMPIDVEGGIVRRYRK